MDEETKPKIEMTDVIEQVDIFLEPLVDFMLHNLETEAEFIGRFVCTYSMLRLMNEFEDVTAYGLMEKTKILFQEMRNTQLRSGVMDLQSSLSSLNPFVT